VPAWRKPPQQSIDPAVDRAKSGRQQLMIGALGVVYGDIGTSPFTP